MRKILFMILGGTLLMLSACNNGNEETSPNKLLANVLAEEDNVKYYGEMTIDMDMEELGEMEMKEWRDGKKSRVEVVRPEKSISVNDGETIMTYEAEQNKVFQFELGELQELNNSPKDQLNLVLDSIKETHNIEKLGNETIIGRDTVHFKAIPKEDGTVFGEQDFWVDTEYWVILKMISKSANIKTELVYTSIDFSSDFKGEVFTLDVPEDAEVETLDTDFSGKEIELEEMIDILGEGVLYVPEENGITIDHISLIEMDAQTNYVDIAYKKDGIAFITLSIISPATDDIEEQIELFGNDAEEVQVRDQNGMYINAKLLQSLVWNEDNFQYNLDMMDPSLTVDGLLDLTEAMKKVE